MELRDGDKSFRNFALFNLRFHLRIWSCTAIKHNLLSDPECLPAIYATADASVSPHEITLRSYNQRFMYFFLGGTHKYRLLLFLFYVKYLCITVRKRTGLVKTEINSSFKVMSWLERKMDVLLWLFCCLPSSESSKLQNVDGGLRFAINILCLLYYLNKLVDKVQTYLACIPWYYTVCSESEALNNQFRFCLIKKLYYIII